MKFAETIIKVEENFRARPYYCTSNIPTIGYGRVIGTKGAPLGNEVTTKEQEIVFVRKRIQEIEQRLSSTHPSAWSKCNDARKAVLISLAYQVGIDGALAFRKMWENLNRGDFELAAREMQNSKWFVQTPNRARRHIEQMKIGSMHMYYLSQGTFI